MVATTFATERRPDVALLIDSGENNMRDGKIVEAVKNFYLARQIADETDNYTQQCLAAYDLAVSQFYLYRYGDALADFQEALKICTVHDLGEQRRVEILNGISGVYFKQNDLAKAQKYGSEAYNCAVKANDVEMQGCMTLNLANIALEQNNIPLANKWMARMPKSALPQNGNAEYLQYLRAVSELKSGNHTAFERRVMQIAARPEGRYAAELLTKLAILKNARGDSGRAIDLCRQILPHAQAPEKAEIYTVMSSAYDRAGDLRRALDTKDSVILYTDSMHKLMKPDLIAAADAQLEIYKIEADNEKRILLMAEHNKIMTLVSCLCVALLLIIILVWRYQRSSHAKNQQLMSLQLEREQREKLLAEQREKENQLLAERNKEIMQRELESKKRELAANSMFLSSRNQMVGEFLGILNEIPQVKDTPRVADYARQLKELVQGGKDLNQFVVDFESAYPHFSQRLLELHPELKHSDIRFLACIKMNMSTKEIAAMMNIAPDSCKRRKIRISQKLGLENSSLLYNHIMSLEL